MAGPLFRLEPDLRPPAMALEGPRDGDELRHKVVRTRIVLNGG